MTNENVGYDPIKTAAEVAAAASAGDEKANAVVSVAGNPASSPTAYLSVAESILGMNERAQRDAIKEFLKDGGVNLDPAQTAWCAGYVNAVFGHSGIDGTGSLAARSFLDWGDTVDDPKEGDVVVFSRGNPSGWQGHVGFFKGFDKDGNIKVLGGNQSDAVNVKSYSKDRLLGYRRPKPAEPAEGQEQQAPLLRGALAPNAAAAAPAATQVAAPQFGGGSAGGRSGGQAVSGIPLLDTVSSIFGGNDQTYQPPKVAQPVRDGASPITTRPDLGGPRGYGNVDPRGPWGPVQDLFGRITGGSAGVPATPAQLGYRQGPEMYAQPATLADGTTLLNPGQFDVGQNDTWNPVPEPTQQWVDVPSYHGFLEYPPE